MKTTNNGGKRNVYDLLGQNVDPPDAFALVDDRDPNCTPVNIKRCARGS